MKTEIVSIVKNEAPYIEEWLCYHVFIGVSHFYIYDHGSTDGTREILERYKTKGIVTITDWSHVPVPAQRLAYADALKKLKDVIHWVGFLDCDEFVEIKSRDLLGKTLDTCALTPSGYSERCGCVISPWVLFGTNGHKTKPEGLVMESYFRSEAGYNQHVKSFVKPFCVESPGNDAHSFKLKQGYMTMTSWELPVDIECYPFHSVPENFEPKIVIHHYHTKSEEEYKARCERGRVDMIQKKKFAVNLPVHDRNEIVNLSLVKYADNVKELMKGFSE